MEKQSLHNKTGEIAFKNKLFRQQIEGERCFEEEYDSAGIEEILLGRMKKTKENMVSLSNKGIVLSPYIEIGAERGQRSLVMENELGSTGAAADLSYDMLLSCGYYAKKFGRGKLPARICCDAYNLPFLSGSVPFIFCYETLHHFPDPLPIIREVYRVLAPGGFFFFDEEPCRGLLQLKLFKSKNKIYSKEAQKRGLFRQIVEFFLYKKSCNETDFGILENDNILLNSWKKKFNFFEKRDISLTSSKNIFSTDVFKPKSAFSLIAAHLFGGILTGLCKKAGELGDFSGKFEDIFRCPECAEKNIESRLQKDPQSFYFCHQCGSKYSQHDGVLVMFVKSELNQIYKKFAE